MQHEFSIEATNNWGGGAPLLVTSNTGNDIPVRSTSMFINDPRQGLDGGSCLETTEVSHKISLADLQKTHRSVAQTDTLNR